MIQVSIVKVEHDHLKLNSLIHNPNSVLEIQSKFTETRLFEEEKQTCRLTEPLLAYCNDSQQCQRPIGVRDFKSLEYVL